MRRTDLHDLIPGDRSAALALARALSSSVEAREREIPPGSQPPFPPASYSIPGARLEAWSRQLWALLPAMLGFSGSETAPPDEWCETLSAYARDLLHGCDPKGEGYWGDAHDGSQLFVEMAVIGLALHLFPDPFGHGYSSAERQRVVTWMDPIFEKRINVCNWLFFRCFTALGLLKLTECESSDYAERRRVWRERLDETIEELLALHREGGWYNDGPSGFRDYYTPFAFHFYGLILNDCCPGHARTPEFRKNTLLFLEDYAGLFDQHGEAIAYGRSMTYRFAQGALFPLCAKYGLLREEEPSLPAWFTLSYVKTMWTRHLERWLDRDIFSDDGCLTVGYAYPNSVMAENYNAYGSPYWCLKSLWALSMPAEHPFWSAARIEGPCGPPDGVRPLPGVPAIGVRAENGGHAYMLNAGQWNNQLWMVRHAEDKYAKLVYSSLFGFGVSTAPLGLADTAIDSTLAVSIEGIYWRTRAHTKDQYITREYAYARWQLWDEREDVVDTWLIPLGPGHLRVHRVEATCGFIFCEGGFACPDDGSSAVSTLPHPANTPTLKAREKDGLCSAGRLLNSQGPIVESSISLQPQPAGGHLLFPRAQVPFIRVKLEAGTTLLCSAWYGGTRSKEGLAWLESLEARAERSTSGDLRLHLKQNDALREFVLR